MFNIYGKFIGGRNIQSAINKIKTTPIFNNKVPIFDMAKEGNKKIVDVQRDTERIINDIKVIQTSINVRNKVSSNVTPVFYAIKGSTFGIDHLPFSQTYNMIREVVNEAQHCQVKVLFDAEQSWHTKSEDIIIDNLLDEKFDVFKTYQMYRKDSLNRLNHDIKLGKVKNVKLVRGAYMEQEKRANTNTTKIPFIHNTKVRVDEAYDKAVNVLLHSAQMKEIMIATHNTHSVIKAQSIAQQRIAQQSIAKNKKSEIKTVYFAQLMGMVNFKEDVLNQSVYIPYGKLTETLPYLVRRLYENKDILKNIFI
jgi:hypothetical protein